MGSFTDPSPAPPRTHARGSPPFRIGEQQAHEVFAGVRWGCPHCDCLTHDRLETQFQWLSLAMPLRPISAQTPG